VNPHLWWYLARASGLVAWALLAASVIFGLTLSTRLSRGGLSPAWITDIHRYLGGSAVVFTAFHLLGLVADSYVSFGVADILVPFASSWRPDAVALGVVALYLLLAIETTSLLMHRIPRRWWKAVHLSSFVLFWIATFHLATAGTDAHNPILILTVEAVAALVVFLTLVRMLSPRNAGRQSARSQRSDPSSTDAMAARG
jgi:predicted ferric reductase